MIPDEAVEAAARAMSGAPERWDRLPEKFRADYREVARTILEAAAPHMTAGADNGRADMADDEFQEATRSAKAEAWDEGYGQGKAVMVKLMSPTHFASETDNPYRTEE